MPAATTGRMRERLALQTQTPRTVKVTSLTQSAGTATAATGQAHGFTTGDFVVVAGATPAGFNGRAKVTVTGERAFTFSVDAALVSPASGTITVVYESDAAGGRAASWRTVATVWAEMMPIRSAERLQLQAVQSDTAYRFRVRTRPDLTTELRARWTPRWPSGAGEQVLEINGVLPWEDGLTYQVLDCAVSPNR